MAFDFGKFVSRVLKAVEGKLPSSDIAVLDRLFKRVKKRNKILAAGLLSTLKVGGASKRDIAEFSAILESANERIYKGERPFTLKDEKALHRIFRGAKISPATERRLRRNLVVDKDDLLAGEIAYSLQERKPFVKEEPSKLKGVQPVKKEKKAVEKRKLAR